MPYREQVVEKTEAGIFVADQPCVVRKVTVNGRVICSGTFEPVHLAKGDKLEMTLFDVKLKSGDNIEVHWTTH